MLAGLDRGWCLGQLLAPSPPSLPLPSPSSSFLTPRHHIWKKESKRRELIYKSHTWGRSWHVSSALQAGPSPPAFSSPPHLSRGLILSCRERRKEGVIQGQCGGLKASNSPQRSKGQPGAQGGVRTCVTRVYKTRGTLGTGAPRQPQHGQQPPPSPSSKASPVFFPRTARS